MAVVAVAADSARYDAMDATTNISGIGGGAGAGAEPDIVYQGSNSISRKVTGGGFYSSTGATRDMTATGRVTWLCKVWLTNYGSLSTGGNSLVVRCGSGTGAYYEYTIGSPTVDYPARGGWVLVAIDPNIASHRDSTTGSPTLTACDYFAAVATCSTSKAENLCLDAIDVGVGLYLTGGDGGDTDGVFSDFVADDEGDITNGRFGYVFTEGGILYVQGQLIIGATSSSGTLTTTATGFTDSGAVIVFPEHKAAAGFSGLAVDVANASTVVDWTSCTFTGRGTAAGEDTRPVVDVTGTSGSFTATGCAFTNFESIDLSAGGTLTGCTLNEVEAMALAGDLTDCTINDHPTATGVAMITTSDLAVISGCAFDNTGGTGHAIEIDTTGTYAFTGNTFTGYGADASNDAAIYNNSGGAVTINILGGGDTPTVRNGASASTTINNTVAVTVTVKDANDSSNIENARVLLTEDTADTVTITRSATTATVTHTAHGYTTGDDVVIRGANEGPYNGIHTITVTGVNSYTYTVSGSPATPATGTITGQFVVLSGLTNASGVITDTGFNYTADLAVSGRARKSTSTPFYKTGQVAGTITSGGFSSTVFLLRDD